MGRHDADDGASRRTVGTVVLLLVLLPSLQVSWAQQRRCFRLDALRLLANLIEAIQPSAHHGTQPPMPFFNLQKLNVLLHMLPNMMKNTTTARSASEIVVGNVKLRLNQKRNIFEVASFPAKLEIIPKHSAFSVAMKKKLVSIEDFDVKPEILFQGLDIIPDSSGDLTTVRLSLNPWTSQARASISQIGIILRTHQKAACEIHVPQSLQEASSLMKSIALLEGNLRIEEVAVINKASLSSRGLKEDSIPPMCGKLLGVAPRSAFFKTVKKIHVSESSKVLTWTIRSGLVRVSPQLLTMLPHPPRKPARTAGAKLQSRRARRPPVEIRVCLPTNMVKSGDIPKVWKRVITKVMYMHSQSSTASSSEKNLHPTGQKKQQSRPQRGGPGSLSNHPSNRGLFNPQMQPQFVPVHIGVIYSSPFTIINTNAQNANGYPSHPPFQTVEPNPPTQIWVNNMYVPVPPPVSLPPAKWSFYSDNPPPPKSVVVNNTTINITPATQDPQQWPFYPEKSPPPRFVWMGNKWEAVLKQSGRWEADSSSQPSQWPLPVTAQPKSVMALVNGTWTLVSTPNLLWNPTTNSFRSPEQIFPAQTDSPPRFIWLQNKWEKVNLYKNVWSVLPSGQAPSLSQAIQSQTGEVYVLVNGVWVLIPSNYIFATTSTAPSRAVASPISKPKSTAIAQPISKSISTAIGPFPPILSSPPQPAPPMPCFFLLACLLFQR